MFRGEGGKPFLQEAAVEIRVVGDDEHYPAQQIVDGSIIDAVTGDHLIANTGDLRDLGRDRESGIFEPLPGAQDFVDPATLTVVFEEADAEFDDLVAIRIGAGGLDIHDSGDELGTVVGRMVFGVWLQPTGDSINRRSRRATGPSVPANTHLAGVPNRLPQRSTRQGAELR